MADNTKISELDQIQSLSNNDEFMVVDKSVTSGKDASSSGKTTRVTLNQLKEAESLDEIFTLLFLRFPINNFPLPVDMFTLSSFFILSTFFKWWSFNSSKEISSASKLQSGIYIVGVNTIALETL